MCVYVFLCVQTESHTAETSTESALTLRTATLTAPVGKPPHSLALATPLPTGCASRRGRAARSSVRGQLSRATLSCSKRCAWPSGASRSYHNEDVSLRQRCDDAFLVPPACAFQEFGDDRGDSFHFLGRFGLISLVGSGHELQAGPRKSQLSA